MATFVAAGLAGKTLFEYNRQNFMFDKDMRQTRLYQQQNMRVEQFMLYREDVRDLVELTVGKMDLYLVMSAVLADTTLLMIAKENDALPRGSPEWAIALNAMSIASATFYLLLALWLAMYASISAQSFGTRLLTQFVRLPIANQTQVDAASAQATNYEGANMEDILRIPILAWEAGKTDAIASGDLLEQQAAGAEEAHDPDPGQLLPTAMLDHIRLYRKVQLNWQAYDAYARVSMFCGASNLLYAFLYFSLGELLEVSNTIVPALGVAAIFASVQLMLCRLDLRLRRRELAFIAVLLALSPICTTVGMLLHRAMMHDAIAGHKSPWWYQLPNSICAIVSHGLHTITVYLVLAATWPDPSGSEEDAMLPGKFRSTLYLDVFGWLLNPTGPGARMGRRASNREAQAEAASPHGSFSSEAGSGSVDAAAASSGSPARPSGLEADAGPNARTAEPVMLQQSRGRANTEPDFGGSRRVRFSEVSSEGGSSDHSARGSSADRIVRRVRQAGRSLGRGVLPSTPALNRHTSFNFASEVVGEAGRLLDGRQSIEGEDDDAQSRGSAGSRPRAMTAPTISSPRGSDAGSTFGSTGSFGPVASSSQEARYGGREAVSMEQMESATRPWSNTAATFVSGEPEVQQSQRQQPAARRRLPGETPWAAFCRGSSFLFCIWICSTLWTLVKSTVGSGWIVAPSHDHPGYEEDSAASFLAAETLAKRVACVAGPGPLALNVVHASRAEVPWVSWHMAAPLTVADAGCGLRRPSLDTALACRHPGDLQAGRCTAVLLRRGGRAISVCRLVRYGGMHGRLVLRPWASLRTAPGSPTLRRLAATASGTNRIVDLRIFGRAADGALVTFRASSSSHGRGFVWPDIEVVAGMPSAQDASPDAVNEELFAAGGHLLSIAPSAADSYLGRDMRHHNDDSCSRTGSGSELHVWDVSSGVYATHRLPRTGRSGQAAELTRFCAAASARGAEL
eukprot:gnl/TRDRNA2_/TRDRNA2_155684_c0_seq2.p1 gnl/TRDRNA2_/TRDRNA2_155684_c0~~gnl/TRDRNA2_/TRDRNA2_155684_c0_seq2.p1  ORF type:complete len:967 (+),score=131.94 gnl/TRDRNA2_/TRDRNA2_155684_c0_seq2:80-2980(+)